MTAFQRVQRSEGGRGRLLAVVGKFGHEIVLVGMAIGLLLLALALLTHSPHDPAWSTTGTGTPLQNWMWEPGAVFANIVYFLFGFSGWWLYGVAWQFWFLSLGRRLSHGKTEAGVVPQVAAAVPAPLKGRWSRFPPLRRLRYVTMLVLLMCASAVLEWSRLYQFESWLPDHAGGVLGRLLGPVLMSGLGMNGAALWAIGVLVVAVAEVFGFSWWRCAESVGRVLDGAWGAVRERWESREDMRIGRQAVLAREGEPFFDPLWAGGAPASSPSTSGEVEAAAVPVSSTTPAPLPLGDPLVDAGPASDVAIHASAPLADAPLDVPLDVCFESPADVSATEEHAQAHAQTERLSAVAAESALGGQSAQPVVDLLFDDLDDVLPSPLVAAAVATTTTSMTTTTVSADEGHPLRSSARPLVGLSWTWGGHDDATSAAAAFKLPSIGLLDADLGQQETVSALTLETTSRLIEQKLKDFGVQVTVVAAAPGPVVTRYEIEPATGVKGSQIVNLSKDLARSLSVISIRVIETIPGKNLMALELPNPHRQTIRLTEVLDSAIYQNASSVLTMGLGKDIAGQPVVVDLAKMPHCLVAGTTGSGKSVGINAMILSLLFRAHPDDVRLMLIDPKMLEMSVYEGIPHLLCPVITDVKQAANGLNWCVAEMDKRYKLMSKLGVRNLAGYNAKIDEALVNDHIVPNPFSLTPEQPEPLTRLPSMVVVIDELADLMMAAGKKIEELIARLAQKARAAGIHLILATQRPSVDVITGLIKANVPTRISFQVSSKIDSRTILDQMGAEALLGMGDMLYMPSGTGYPIRVHGAFVGDEEVHRVVQYLKAQGGEPQYIEGILEGPGTDVDGVAVVDADRPLSSGSNDKDELYDQAVEIVLRERKASISYVQRKLNIGYNRAARLLENMEQAGLVSSLTRSGQRNILVPQRSE